MFAHLQLIYLTVGSAIVSSNCNLRKQIKAFYVFIEAQFGKFRYFFEMANCAICVISVVSCRYVIPHHMNGKGKTQEESRQLFHGC